MEDIAKTNFLEVFSGGVFGSLICKSPEPFGDYCICVIL